jgi:exocyst complex component 4
VNFSRFDALLATFQQLAEQSLFTLRVELRCHTLHYIDKAMREVSFVKNIRFILMRQL